MALQWMPLKKTALWGPEHKSRDFVKRLRRNPDLGRWPLKKTSVYGTWGEKMGCRPPGDQEKLHLQNDRAGGRGSNQGKPATCG